MKRSELTAQKMIDRKFMPAEGVNYDYHYDAWLSKMTEIVNEIQAKEEDGTYTWKHLRCITKGSYVRDRYDICAHYKEFFKYEFFEMSKDGKEWTAFAKRPVVYNEVCVYAD